MTGSSHHTYMCFNLQLFSQQSVVSKVPDLHMQNYCWRLFGSLELIASLLGIFYTRRADRPPLPITVCSVVV